MKEYVTYVSGLAMVLGVALTSFPAPAAPLGGVPLQGSGNPDLVCTAEA